MRPVKHDQLQEVPRPIRAENQVAQGILADLVDHQSATKCVLNVLINDSVSKRRPEELHAANVLQNRSASGSACGALTTASGRAHADRVLGCVVTTPPDSQRRGLIARLEAAHREEDVDAYVSLFGDEAVWVTSRGICYRGRAALRDYLRKVVPGGLAGGSVTYHVESVTELAPEVSVVVVDQTYVDATGQQTPGGRHAHTYVLLATDEGPRIGAGQNTTRNDV